MMVDHEKLCLTYNVAKQLYAGTLTVVKMWKQMFCSHAFHQLLLKWILIMWHSPVQQVFLVLHTSGECCYPEDRVHFVCLKLPSPQRRTCCKHAHGCSRAFLIPNVLRALWDPASPSETNESTTTKRGVNNQMMELFANLGASRDAWQLQLPRQRTNIFSEVDFQGYVVSEILLR